MVGKVSLEKLQEWSGWDGVGVILAPNATLTPQKEVTKSFSLAS